jgi:hypothetical protein
VINLRVAGAVAPKDRDGRRDRGGYLTDRISGSAKLSWVLHAKTHLFRLPPERNVRTQHKHPSQARQCAALTDSTDNDTFRQNSVVLDFGGDELVDGRRITDRVRLRSA